MVDEAHVVIPWTSRWHRHPGVRTGGQLSTGERAADTVRNGELIAAVERLTREVHAATVTRPATAGPTATAPAGVPDVH